MDFIINLFYKLFYPKQLKKDEIANRIIQKDIESIMKGEKVKIPFINEYSVDEIFLDESGRIKAKIKLSVKKVQKLLEIKAEYETENSVELQNYELGIEKDIVQDEKEY